MTTDWVEEEAGKARQDVGEQARQAQLAVKAARQQAAGEIGQEIRVAQSGLEREAQAALSTVRQQQLGLGRKGDLPGYGAARAIGKKYGRTSETEIKAAVEKSAKGIEQAKHQAMMDLARWNSEQSANIAQSAQEAEQAINEWKQKSFDALANLPPSVTDTPPGGVTSPALSDSPEYYNAISVVEPWKTLEGNYNLTQFELYRGLETKQLLREQADAYSRMVELDTPEAREEYYRVVADVDRRQKTLREQANAFKLLFAAEDIGLARDIASDMREITEYNNTLAKIDKWRSSDGTYDLTAIMREGTADQRIAASKIFGKGVVDQARIAVEQVEVKPDLDIREWENLDPKAQEFYHPVAPMDVEAWLKLPDYLKKEFYVKPIEVSASTYAGLGETARQHVI